MGTTPAHSVRTFRSSRWVVLGSAIIAVAFGLVAVYYYQSQGVTWLTLTYCGLAAIAIGAVIEGMTTAVSITNTELAISHHLRRRTYQRSDLVDASWGYGAPASVKLIDGNWVRLPGVGKNTQSMAMILKAWIKSGHVA